MPPLRSTALRHYVIGLGAVFVGAGLMDATGSTWPLALGGATAVMCTVRLVTAIWSRRP